MTKTHKHTNRQHLKNRTETKRTETTMKEHKLN